MLPCHKHIPLADQFPIHHHIGPALLEALALNFADNTDAKMETMIEALNAGNAGNDNKGWLGYNRLLETNIRKTSE